MSVVVNVRSDVKRVVAEFRAEQKAVTKATFRALNRALDKVATETSREIRKEYNLKHAAVLSALRKRRANSNSLFAQLTAEGMRLGLIHFSPLQNRRGVSVRILKKGARQTVAGAFIATRRWQSWQDKADQSHTGVFRRRGTKRLPIAYLRSVSIPQAFANEAVRKALETVALETFNKNFEQQMRFLTRAG